MAENMGRCKIKFSLLMAVIALCLIMSAGYAFADDGYYKTNTIYTEGIYVADGVYVEPCFEHYSGQSETYKALRVKGDMPEGTQYTLFAHVGDKYEITSKEIPDISGIGVYRVDVTMPGKAPVTFQAEIVLEGIKPCEAISGKTETDGETTDAYDSIKFVNEPARETYNMARGESPGNIPVYSKSDVVQWKYSEPDESHDISDHIRRFVKVRAHTLIMDIDGTPFGTLQREEVSAQLYKSSFSFASHDEMKANREQYGD